MGMNLTAFHGFHDSVRWRLTSEGIEVEGTGLERTPGAPNTVTRIWERFSGPINAAAEQFGVPCALIVATAATESQGNPSALRKEPGYRSDDATPHRISPGIMQTLISTARDALNNPAIDRSFLLDPANSILAGTAYMAHQRSKTELDPPKVGAAYNAGSLIHQRGARNRWKMRQFPIGTAEHCDRFIRWFNDAVAVLEAHPVRPAVPYTALLAGVDPRPPVVRRSARVIVAANVKRGGKETEALIAYMQAAGVPCRVTSVVRSALPSRHAQVGTGGNGLAVDFAGPAPGLDTDEMAAIFKAFEPVESQLHELIYAGPQVQHNIKRGKRVAKYAVADHHNHVHVSVDKGTLIKWPGGPGGKEDKMQRVVHTTKRDGSQWEGRYITDDMSVAFISTPSRLVDLEERYGPAELIPRDSFDQLQKLGAVGWPD